MMSDSTKNHLIQAASNLAQLQGGTSLTPEQVETQRKACEFLQSQWAVAKKHSEMQMQDYEDEDDDEDDE